MATRAYHIKDLFLEDIFPTGSHFVLSFKHFPPHLTGVLFSFQRDKQSSLDVLWKTVLLSLDWLDYLIKKHLKRRTKWAILTRWKWMMAMVLSVPPLHLWKLLWWKIPCCHWWHFFSFNIIYSWVTQSFGTSSSVSEHLIKLQVDLKRLHPARPQ